MRYLMSGLVVLAMVVPAAALVNSSWEMGNNTGWTQSGGGIVTNGTPGYPGDAPGESDGYVWGMNTNWATASGNNMQADVPGMAAASYDVTADAWLKLFDTGGFPSSITAELLIDGVVQDTQALSGSAVDTAWTQVNLSYSGPISTDAALRITGNIDGRDGRDIDIGSPWAWAWADGTSLTITPEPASLLLLGLAGIPMLLRRRRH